MRLEKIALITAILGILLLVYLSSSLEPKLVKISDINGNMMDNYVRISGEIIKLKTYDKFSVFSIKDSTDEINVISYQNLSNMSGNIEVTGKVTSWKGMLELEASEIKSAGKS